MVDPGVGAHKAELVLDYDRTHTCAQNFIAFAQDEFCYTWILAAFLGQFECSGRRRHCCKIDEPIFSFTDNFLGQNKDVAIFKRQIRLLQRRQDYLGEIIAGFDHRNTLKLRKSDGHAENYKSGIMLHFYDLFNPVILMPALVEPYCLFM